MHKRIGLAMVVVSCGFTPRTATAQGAVVKNMKLPFTDPRYEMRDPKVQRHGDAAVLTFNLVNHGKLPGRPEGPLSRWNAYDWAGVVLQGEWRP